MNLPIAHWLSICRLLLTLNLSVQALLNDGDRQRIQWHLPFWFLYAPVLLLVLFSLRSRSHSFPATEMHTSTLPCFCTGQRISEDRNGGAPEYLYSFLSVSGGNWEELHSTNGSSSFQAVLLWYIFPSCLSLAKYLCLIQMMLSEEEDEDVVFGTGALLH